MDAPKEDSPQESLAARLARIEERVSRLESVPASDAVPERAAVARKTVPTPAERAEVATEAVGARDKLEFEVGQNVFAKVGILILAIGAGFALSLPYASLSACVPSVLGFALVAGIFVLVRLFRNSFDTLARHLRGGGLALLYFATLRLFFFGVEPALVAGSGPGIAVLLAAVAVCFVVALRQESPGLTVLALLAGHVTALVVPHTWFTLPAIALLAVAAAQMRIRRHWPWLLLVGMFLSYATHAVWMLNRPVLGNPLQWVREPVFSVYFILLYAVIHALGSSYRQTRATEDPPTIIGAFLNGGLAFPLFFLATEAVSLPGFNSAYVAATVVFLALAILFWVREQSRFSTFVYAMSGYLALSVAIIKVSAVPNVFVWLSLQSLLVVATAVWFQSRFIVLANFLIFLATVAGYVVLAETKSGVSIVFGVVALFSARILNWKKERLRLTTEAMRNAYLGCVFIAFPYALYQMVPRNYVSLSWIGVALFYYLMNLIVSVRKYRWMGHATLLGTALYVLVVGIIQLKPAHRILSFIVLGVALVVVSLVFTRLRAKAAMQPRATK